MSAESSVLTPDPYTAAGVVDPMSIWDDALQQRALELSDERASILRGAADFGIETEREFRLILSATLGQERDALDQAVSTARDSQSLNRQEGESQTAHLRRVAARIGVTIRRFWRERLDSGEVDFHMEDLVAYVRCDVPRVAPDSASRILRDLRRPRGEVNYMVVSRRNSHYRCLSLDQESPPDEGGNGQDESILDFVASLGDEDFA